MSPTSEQKQRIRKFVDTLKTTDKKQSTGRLAVRVDGEEKFCCLGIACEVAIESGLELQKRTDTPHQSYWYGADLDENASTLPKAVQDWYGFHFSDPLLTDEKGVLRSASELNDLDFYNFKEIAAAFERTYLNDENEGTTTDVK